MYIITCFEPGCRLSSTSSRHLSVPADLAAKWRRCVTYASPALKHASVPLPLQDAVACCDSSSRSL